MPEGLRLCDLPKETEDSMTIIIGDKKSLHKIENNILIKLMEDAENDIAFNSSLMNNLTLPFRLRKLGDIKHKNNEEYAEVQHMKLEELCKQNADSFGLDTVLYRNTMQQEEIGKFDREEANSTQSLHISRVIFDVSEDIAHIQAQCKIANLNNKLTNTEEGECFEIAARKIIEVRGGEKVNEEKADQSEKCKKQAETDKVFLQHDLENQLSTVAAKMGKLLNELKKQEMSHQELKVWCHELYVNIQNDMKTGRVEMPVSIEPYLQAVLKDVFDKHIGILNDELKKLDGVMKNNKSLNSLLLKIEQSKLVSVVKNIVSNVTLLTNKFNLMTEVVNEIKLEMIFKVFFHMAQKELNDNSLHTQLQELIETKIVDMLEMLEDHIEVKDMVVEGLLNEDLQCGIIKDILPILRELSIVVDATRQVQNNYILSIKRTGVEDDFNKIKNLVSSCYVVTCSVCGEQAEFEPERKGKFLNITSKEFVKHLQYFTCTCSCRILDVKDT